MLGGGCVGGVWVYSSRYIEGVGRWSFKYVCGCGVKGVGIGSEQGFEKCVL